MAGPAIFRRAPWGALYIARQNNRPPAILRCAAAARLARFRPVLGLPLSAPGKAAKGAARDLGGPHHDPHR
ncbi:hypothetical protein EMQ_2364 [Acetobacter aceti NBRC 14818]|uniref:Uncharacterized protein n=1 Tax=Acetobacter aceti NBRC 14818 TaxID=887700 RepID=A0AB33IHQ7_ACEAC|nr:hypothetical protein EMQ_2364 [Acetobacter aceti NBRC 14818]GAN58812.1 hypothetical protein Abac_079_004 [Acetobacter aceti NBRC 14818]